MEQERAERATNGQNQENLRNKINKTVLEYNPKCNRIIWVLIDINKWLRMTKKRQICMPENSK